MTYLTNVFVILLISQNGRKVCTTALTKRTFLNYLNCFPERMVLLKHLSFLKFYIILDCHMFKLPMS